MCSCNSSYNKSHNVFTSFRLKTCTWDSRSLYIFCIVFFLVPGKIVILIGFCCIYFLVTEFYKFLSIFFRSKCANKCPTNFLAKFFYKAILLPPCRKKFYVSFTRQWYSQKFQTLKSGRASYTSKFHLNLQVSVYIPLNPNKKKSISTIYI